MFIFSLVFVLLLRKRFVYVMPKATTRSSSKPVVHSVKSAKAPSRSKSLRIKTNAEVKETASGSPGQESQHKVNARSAGKLKGKLEGKRGVEYV